MYIETPYLTVFFIIVYCECEFKILHKHNLDTFFPLPTVKLTVLLGKTQVLDLVLS